MINPGEKVVVGVSGGPDSMALLFCLLKYREEVGIEIEVAHVNHGLRGRESDLDEQLVQEFSQKHGLKFHTKKLCSLKTATENLQAEARRRRYEFFFEILEKTGATKIALAHTASDVAETVMMNILRGAGTEGLCGIWPVRGKIIRPLFSVFRREVMAFLEEERIPYRVDSSNLVPKYLRNKVRLKLFPYINEEFGTDIEERLFNLAQIKQEENQVLEKHLKELWQKVYGYDGQGYLDVRILQNLSSAEAGLILRKFWEEATGTKRDLYQEHIESLLAFCSDLKGTRYLMLPRGIRARLSYGKLYFEAKNFWQNIKFFYEITPPGQMEIPEVGKKIIITPAPQDNFDLMLKEKSLVVVRNRRPGDRFTFKGHTKKLKEWLIDLKIPKDLRDRLVILEINGLVAWVEGLGPGDLFKKRIFQSSPAYKIDIELLKSC
ncbi:tRNA(Ile)-lysidine synthetase [Carboxydothermus pertinax]|uniref:tRNA(Ile)-lysidine synthase n=2 Tax=Carboxydothermus pertinax TaxID=870242 RepID=A0A1L8CYP8_9THEO|nr:tRNA(Ile)-lysidine synthetase [Carboxydothermus pertinax]